MGALGHAQIIGVICVFVIGKGAGGHAGIVGQTTVVTGWTGSYATVVGYEGVVVKSSHCWAELYTLAVDKLACRHV